MKKKIINLVAAITILTIGILIGLKIPRKTIAQSSVKDDSFQAGWEAAKERLKQSPFGYVSPSEVNSVSGIIQKVDGNKLEVKINPMESLSDPSLDVREVLIDSNTKLTIDVSKDQEQFQKEMQEFEKKMQALSGSEPINPPLPYEKKDLNAADLKQNQKIYITAKENIKDLKQFTAAQIDAQN